MVSTDPNADGRNTVIALTTGSNIDDNLEYTVTNSVAGTPWNQDMGDVVPATLNATNSGLFKIFVQSAAGLVSFLPATRFPFAWDTGTNRPETISSIGARITVPDNRWFVYFAYATSNPTSGDAIKLVSAPAEFTSIVNARAFNWVDIQNLYPTLFGFDTELRPLYRIIFYNDATGPGAFPAGCKYSVIRETQDLRKSSTTSTTAVTGSLPASSVTFAPFDGITSTNAQAAIEELATEKANVDNPTFTTTVTSPTFVATQVTGTAPFTVTSTTRVANLNVASAGNSDTVTTNANLTDDVTSIGNSTTLKTVNSNVGAFGSSTAIPVVTVNAKGLVTGVTTATVAGGQYFGAASTKAIAYNSNTIGENVTITSGNNGGSFGVITINDGFVVTVEAGASWTII